MTEQELNFLSGEMLRARTYLEFGSGNSDYMVDSLPHLRKITVVESDDTFFQANVGADENVRRAIESSVWIIIILTWEKLGLGAIR